MQKIPGFHHVAAAQAIRSGTWIFIVGYLVCVSSNAPSILTTWHRAIFNFGEMVPLIPDTIPDLLSVRFWIGADDQGPIAPASEMKRLAKLLHRTGADLTIRFAKAAHGLTNRDVEAAPLARRGHAKGLKA